MVNTVKPGGQTPPVKQNRAVQITLLANALGKRQRRGRSLVQAAQQNAPMGVQLPLNQPSIFTHQRAGEGPPQVFLAAARQGDEGSQNNLGTMYEAGRGVRSSQVTALMWYEIAVANGSERGQINYKRLKRKLSEEEVRKAQKRAHNCLQSRYRECGES